MTFKTLPGEESGGHFVGLVASNPDAGEALVAGNAVVLAGCHKHTTQTHTSCENIKHLLVIIIIIMFAGLWPENIDQKWSLNNAFP